MYKLEQKAYSVAQPLLNTLSTQHVAVAAVLDGTLTGDIWIDDRVDPAVALLANGDAFYLAGDPGRGSGSFADLGREIPAWAYLFVDDPWVGLLDRVWSNAFARPHPRIRFGLAYGRQPEAAGLPEGFRLAPIDRALVEAAPGNVDTVTDLFEDWPSADDFLQKGVGFCILHDGDIVSHCATDSVSGDRCELGVGTEPDFRRLGLGGIAAAATISECVKRGIHGIEWHTHASNKGSIAIARNAGLVETDRHFAYSGNLPAENIGDLDAATCKDWALHLEKASLEIGWCRFHAAGAWALIGERDRALANIGKLVEGGWEGEAEWLEGYWALASLIDDPQFQSLVARHRQAQAV
ncbi:hypothetical protein LPJGGPFB_04268 [Ensifer adhaerens]|uniref:GNAT family N-acetyltransferase n=1 Tax=Ensifer adhaerens TaxID=106592 RepID=UPI0015690A19|nr:GNAT family N-acetyltransferase [Ensifer adhaerens]NRP21009.1 hypothetical protein [Ensifer adhaerens]